MSKTVIPQNTDTDRLKRVKKNRQVQLQRWINNEKELEKSQLNGIIHRSNTRSKHIAFAKETMLLDAVSRNDLKEVRELLSQGVNPNAATVDGLTGLHQCCIDDFREMAELLLQYNANVNSVDSEKWTPLHAASTCGHGHMCTLLGNHGSDFLFLNADGNMPYDICEGDDALRILENEMDKRGITQKQINDARAVTEKNMLRDLKVLYQSKGNLDELDSQGAAMIHIGCCLGFNEVVQTLLEVGANYSLPDKDGWLPVHLAACWSHVDIVEVLAVYGADLDLPNSNGDTIFNLCETEIRDRLLHIKENLSEIRKNYNFNRLPPYKSLRRSRGSSVRRISVRQKNMISKKEAKEEFIALTQNISSEPKSLDQDSSGDRPSTIEEYSDVDSVVDVKPTVYKATVLSLKTEDNSKKRSVSRPSSGYSSFSRHPVAGTDPASPKTTPTRSNNTALGPTLAKSENYSNHNHTNNDKVETPLLVTVSMPRRTSLANVKTTSDVEALDKPRYVFSSTSESWGNMDESKRRRRHKCCVLL